MNEQEEQIIRLLLNEMAFEGAAKLFRELPPDINIELFHHLERIGIPLKYDGEIENYRYEVVKFDEHISVFENCYKYLRVIRNNIIHANKAYRPDPSERLSDLLNWSDSLIESVYQTDSDFAKRACEIKSILRIESY